LSHSQIVDSTPVHIKNPLQPPPSICDLRSNDLNDDDDNSLNNAQHARSKVLRSSEFSTLNFTNNCSRLRVKIWILSLAVFLTFSLQNFF
jgi:hypothetical protein